MPTLKNLENDVWCSEKYKKFELMLTRRAKAYSSSCSQTLSLASAISSQFIFGVCAGAEDRKNQLKNPYYGS